MDTKKVFFLNVLLILFVFWTCKPPEPSQDPKSEPPALNLLMYLKLRWMEKLLIRLNSYHSTLNFW